MISKKKIVFFSLLFLLMCFIFYIIYLVASGEAFETKINRFDETLREELKNKYSINLPADIDFVDGVYSHGREKSTDIHFYVSKEQFKNLLSDKWEEREYNSSNYVFYQDLTDTKNMKHYESKQHTYTFLFYDEQDDKVECVFIGG